MRIVKMGEKEIGIAARVPGIFIYEQEFGSDLLGDLLKMSADLVRMGEGLSVLINAVNEKGELDATKIDPDKINFEAIASGLNTSFLLKLVWVMAKTYKGPNTPFPGFEEWLYSLDPFNVADPSFFIPVINEAKDGFFPAGATGAGSVAKSGKPAKKL